MQSIKKLEQMGARAVDLSQSTSSLSRPPASTKPVNTMLLARFLSLDNLPFLAMLMPYLSDPCRSDGTLDIGLLNRRIYRDLQSELGRKTTVSALGEEPRSKVIVNTENVRISINSPIIKLHSPQIYEIYSHSSGYDGRTEHDRCDGVTITGLKLNIQFGSEQLSMHIGEYSHRSIFNPNTELNRLFNDALFLRYSIPKFSNRHLSEKPNEIAMLSALLSDMVADFQDRESGNRLHSHLFPASSASFDVASVKPENFLALLYPSRDSSGQHKARISFIVDHLERIVASAKLEGITDTNKCNASLSHLKEKIADLDNCFHFNSRDYLEALTPNYLVVAKDIQLRLKESLDHAKEIAKLTSSMLLFEQLHQVFSDVRQVTISPGNVEYLYKRLVP